jgi:hypothetical protein
MMVGCTSSTADLSLAERDVFDIVFAIKQGDVVLRMSSNLQRIVHVYVAMGHVTLRIVIEPQHNTLYTRMYEYYHYDDDCWAYLRYA